MDKVYAEGVNSVVEFLDKYYKPSRFRLRGEEYANAVIKSAEEEIKNYGCTLASRHESNLGVAVWYYPDKSNEPVSNSYKLKGDK